MAESWDGIWGYIYAVTKDPHTTDDLAQDVFVRAYTHWDQFRGESSRKTWLFKIARNICRDHQRSAFFRRVIPMDAMKLHNVSSAHARSSEDEAMQVFENHALWEAIFRLRKIYREVILLHIREDLTFKEIASILNVSESTVRSRYRRALEQLQDTIGKEMMESGI
ncbi:sigma-70 family RNA polymerase sigma factor [Alicyclobacillus macrosporangiidus]|uniref:RNA polymerase sigma factor n=1 Tax=Alicyclobacillus macrosporangiidus TaxID=392015 RepID=UPI0009DDA5FE